MLSAGLMGHLAHMQTLLPLRVAVCLFFRSSARSKRFTWKWLDFHENEWTGEIHIVLHKDLFCNRGQSELGIGLFIHELAYLINTAICRLTFLHILATCFSKFSLSSIVTPRSSIVLDMWICDSLHSLHVNVTWHWKPCISQSLGKPYIKRNYFPSYVKIGGFAYSKSWRIFLFCLF